MVEHNSSVRGTTGGDEGSGNVPGAALFEAGTVVLQSGETLPETRLVYTTHGTLNARRDNAIIFPTCYAGRHGDNDWLIGSGKALDTDAYFVVVPDMLGNGLSSSPSNTPPPHDRMRFPRVTILDNVLLQHRLLRETFGVEHLRLAVGFSMGAQQVYQWAVSFPSMVERAVAICGTATCSAHNWVFLEGVTAALRADAAWHHGDYDAPPTIGLRALARVWAGWGLSQSFYRARHYEALGYSTVEDFLLQEWETSFLDWDANDLLAMAWTWQHADVGTTPEAGGNTARALGLIEARTLVMPSRTDLYFPPEDHEIDAERIRGAQLRVIPSVAGHQAGGGGGLPGDAEFVATAVAEWLAR